MNEFLLIIHQDKDVKPTLEEVQQVVKNFQEWLGGIAAQNKLVTPHRRWDAGGRVVKQDVVLNGPYAEIKESVGGLAIVLANNYDEAVEIAKGCPILKWGGTVEVRRATPGYQL